MVSRRRALAQDHCRDVGERLVEPVRVQAWYRDADRLACYLPMAGEADPRAIAVHALAAGKAVHVPVIRGRTLVFRKWRPGCEVRTNRFGIGEPAAGEEVGAAELDLVFTPLVAFDESGNRIGMGSGFYDRTFAFLIDNSPRRPRLVGVAYEFQRVERIEPQPWDVPLDAVVTEAGWQSFTTEHDTAEP